MKTTKIHEFDPVIYPRKLWVVISNSEDFLNEKFNHECNLDGFSEKSKAIVFPCSLVETGDLGVIVVFTKKSFMDIKNISHESVHIASVIFSDCGMMMGFDEGRDEHFAYLVGWAAECIDKVKRGKA